MRHSDQTVNSKTVTQSVERVASAGHVMPAMISVSVAPPAVFANGTGQ